MARITVQGLTKSYGGVDLFSGLSFEIQPGMRLAVAGPNGGGKSTLLKLLAGRLEPDGGQISMERGAMLGYVAQELEGEVLERNLLAWVLEALPSWTDFWAEWERAVQADDKPRLEALSHRQAEFEQQFGYNPEHRARAILTGLGFSEDDLLKRLAELSGGWRERAKLARVLFQGADVLLLDEPTNHLDLEAIEWLEDYLLSFRGALVFVAHDRVLLEKVGTHVLFISAGLTAMRRGSFSQFLEWEAEQARLREKEVAKLSDKIESEMSYIRRFRVKARKAAQAQSKLKKVEKLEQQLKEARSDVQVSRTGRSLSFRLPPAARGDKVAVSCAGVRFSYGSAPSIWNGLDMQLFRGKKIALVAPNGAGKSTLIKLINGALKPDDGVVKLGPKTTIGYFSQHQTDILNTESTVLGEIRRLADPKLTEEQLMGVLGLFLLGESYFERRVGALSGGEKNRLVLATLFLARANLLILDEPTNHLDLESRMGLVSALKDYDGTLLFVAHDRYLLSEVAEEVWELRRGGIEVHAAGFEAYDARRRARLAGKDAPNEPASAGRTPQAGQPEQPATAQPAVRRLSKDEKRRMAEERNKLYRKLKPLKDEYDKLEKDLERALADQGALEERMNDPATYEKPEEAIRLNAEYRGVGEWVEELMERMGELEAAMEPLSRRREELAAEGGAE
jgi:ATP-binding cassette subfamily F protein 3